MTKAVIHGCIVFQWARFIMSTFNVSSSTIRLNIVFDINENSLLSKSLWFTRQATICICIFCNPLWHDSLIIWHGILLWLVICSNEICVLSVVNDQQNWHILWFNNMYTMWGVSQYGRSNNMYTMWCVLQYGQIGSHVNMHLTWWVWQQMSHLIIFPKCIYFNIQSQIKCTYQES